MKYLISLSSRKSRIALIMVLILLLHIILPIIKVNAANTYKVLFWHPDDNSNVTNRAEIIKKHFQSISGVTVIEKTSGALTEAQIRDVKLIYILDCKVGMNDTEGRNIINSSNLIKNFVNAGGRVVMNGERPGFADAGNEVLSNLAARIGGNFTITSVESDNRDMILNTTDKKELIEGLNASNLNPDAYSHISSTNPDAIWVAKDKDNKVFILDQATGNGYITALADIDWLSSGISNYYDYSNGRNATNRRFLQNILVSSAKNMDTSYKINEGLTYNGEEQVGITFKNATITAGTDRATNVGTYTVTLTPNERSTWSDGTSTPREISWSINKKSLTIPTLTDSSKPFTDLEQSPTINDFNDSTMTQDGIDTAKNVDDYTITWSLIDTDNYQWSDGTIEDKSASWEITPIDLPDEIIKFDDNEVTYDGEEHSINIVGEILDETFEYSTDGENFSETDLTYTDAGEYTIYYKIIKPNYNDKLGSNVLTINKKTITEEEIKKTVSIENQIYTKEKVEPEIVIKDGDRIVPKTEYTVEYSNNIKPGIANVVIKNAEGGNYIIETTELTFVIIEPGTVKYIKSKSSNANNAKVIEKPDEIIAKINLTEKDVDNIKHGKNIDVYLEVKDISDSIQASDKKAIEEKLEKDNLGLYLDVSLFKKVTGEEATKITETKKPITISFELPDELINKDPNIERTYKVLRLHDGVVEELEVKVNGKTATFETDKFSTYALTYADTEKTSSPKTGDSVTMYVIMFIVSLLGIRTLSVSNKRKSKKARR